MGAGPLSLPPLGFMQASEATVPDSDELARFREQWWAEVRRKKGLLSTPQASGDRDAQPEPASDATAADDTLHPQSPTIAHPIPIRVPSDVVSPPAKKPQTDASLAPYGKVLSKAVDVYRRAVQCEQQSNLDEALELYRAAFRMDSNVDRAYYKLETQAQYAATGAPSTSGAPALADKPPRRETTSISSSEAVDDIMQGVKALDMHSVVVPVTETGSAVATGTLASLLASWPRDLAFEPENETVPTPLQRLPDELLVLVLRSLDTATLERFAAVNRKARVVTLDSEIWRDFVRAMYKPPQIPDNEDIDVLLHQYLTDYRRFFIEHPRVRLDGVYIAVCHYIRSGLSENAWVNVSHLITYHRYLRFYPNGQVISLLANENMAPQQVIPVLKPTLRMKGLAIGNWELTGNTVLVTSLLDPSAGSQMKFAFQMTLELRSRPLGRWNRLEFRAYDTVDIESGEATPLPLAHERPFWFSKVKSYA